MVLTELCWQHSNQKFVFIFVDIEQSSITFQPHFAGEKYNICTSKDRNFGRGSKWFEVG